MQCLYSLLVLQFQLIIILVNSPLQLRLCPHLPVRTICVPSSSSPCCILQVRRSELRSDI
jgi:hypothetical protein